MYYMLFVVLGIHQPTKQRVKSRTINTANNHLPNHLAQIFFSSLAPH